MSTSLWPETAHCNMTERRRSFLTLIAVVLVVSTLVLRVAVVVLESVVVETSLYEENKN